MPNRIKEYGGSAVPTANAVPDTTIQLERKSFYPGERVTGIVTMNVTRPTRLRGIRVRLVGVEQVQVHYGKQIKWVKTPTIDQEFVLVGRDRLPDVGSVIVDSWDALLQRGRHTTLSPGEFIYPFSIPVPGHTPPTYQGKIVKVDYKLEITVDRPLVRSWRQVLPITILPPVKEALVLPVLLSVTGNGLAAHEKWEPGKQPRLEVKLDKQEFLSGGVISGEYTVWTIDTETPESLIISLRSKEETYARGGSGTEQWDTARLRVTFEDVKAPVQKGKFSLQVPQDTPPSISGSTFALTYRLDIRLSAAGSSDLTLQVDIGITSPPLQL